MAVSYDKNTDYQALINKSVANNDFGAAAQYEQQRNAKIQGEGMSQSQTSKYIDYLPSQNYINQMYDNQKKSTLSNLEATYKQNVSALDNTAKQIPQQYYEQKREVEGNAAIQRKNMNEVMNANGLNTGATGQANLAMSNQTSANLSALNKAQASAQSNLELQRSNLTTQYQTAVQQAIADNDYKKAQALYTEYQANQERQRQKEEQARSTAQNQVDALLKMGVRPSDALVAQSGYSPDYINQYYNAYLAQIGGSGGGGGGGGSRRSSGGGDDTSSTPTNGTRTSSAFVDQLTRNTAAVNASKGMDSNTKKAYADSLLSQGLISGSTANAITNSKSTSKSSTLKYIPSSQRNK